MGEFTVRALVLRRFEQGDADRRLILLTRDHGKLDAIAKGARKAASRLAGMSDPLCVGSLTLAEGKRRRYVVQAQPERAFRGLRSDYDRLQQAISLCELADAILPWEEPVPEAFEVLESSLGAIEAHPRPVVAYLWAQCRLLQGSGFQPSLATCVTTGLPPEVANPWISPEAGGLVAEATASDYDDRYRVRAEALFGLSRLGDLEAPPAQMKYVAEAAIALFPFWRFAADSRLPATEAIVQELRLSLA